MSDSGWLNPVYTLSDIDDDDVAECDECGKTWPIEDLVMAKYEPAGWVWNKDGDAYICPNCTGVKP